MPDPLPDPKVGNQTARHQENGVRIEWQWQHQAGGEYGHADQHLQASHFQATKTFSMVRRQLVLGLDTAQYFALSLIHI